MEELVKIDRKILLISANRYDVPYPVFPLGVLALESSLKLHLPDSEIRIVDANLCDLDGLVLQLKDFNPDFIGLSIRNIDNNNYYDSISFTSDYKLLVERIRDNSSGLLVVGGSGFSIFPQRIMELLHPDFGIIGAGEFTLVRLIKSIEHKLDFNQLEGLVFFSGLRVVINRRKDEVFLQEANLGLNRQLISYYWKYGGMLNVQTKRGCPFSCIFCSYPLIEGTTVRTLDPDLVVDYLHRISKEGVTHVFITDSVFNLDDEYNYVLAEKIIRKGLRIAWTAYFTPRKPQREVMKAMQQAGLTHIEYGTDSLSEIQLVNYGKSFSVDEVMQSTAICNELGIYCAHFLILGGYGETIETLEETFSRSAGFGPTVFFPFIGMRIYPGTELEKIALRGKIIPDSCDLLEPKYYLSDKIMNVAFKEKASLTGKAWVFPDEDLTSVIKKFRLKNKKGPLWHYLIK